MSFRDKKILITAGPTWVPIDSVRVISNTATGETGALLADKLFGLGAKVTLLLGPVDYCCLNKKIRLINFKYFNELNSLIEKELKSGNYDAVIHTAAVSDYRPAKVSFVKIKSGKKNWKLHLIPTPKIIDSIKKTDKAVFLVGFKFDSGIGKNSLLKKAWRLKKRTKAELIVANTLSAGKYRAYIISGRNQVSPFSNKFDMSKRLIELIKQGLCKN
jgi:phosphopantothenoylcysteine synthetase/decarboxylase